MALFKLLCSILLVSLTGSAPVEVSTGHEFAETVVSDGGKDVTRPTHLDDLTSSARPPTDQSDWAAGSKESEPSKQSDPVPTDVAKEEQTTSQSSLESVSGEAGVTQISENENQQTGNENIDQQSGNPEVDPPAIDASQQKASETTPPFDQPGRPQENDGIPAVPNPPDSDIKEIPSVFEDPNTPLQLSERDEIPGNLETPQGPYEDSPIDQTPPPFNEDSANDDGRDAYPQSPINEESAIQEDVRQPFEFPPEEEAAKEIPPESAGEDDTEIPNELQNSDEANIGNNPPSVDRNPTEIAEPDNKSPFDAYDYPGDENEESPELPPSDVSDIPAEQEEGSPGLPFPITGTPEEMVDDPVEVPMKEEEPPVIAMAGDGLASPPVLAVIQIGQVPPQQYGIE